MLRPTPPPHTHIHTPHQTPDYLHLLYKVMRMRVWRGVGDEGKDGEGGGGGATESRKGVLMLNSKNATKIVKCSNVLKRIKM